MPCSTCWPRIGAECKGGVGEQYLGTAHNPKACALKCRLHGTCTYFVYGTGHKAGRCYKEGDFGDDCESNDGGGFQSDA